MNRNGRKPTPLTSLALLGLLLTGTAQALETQTNLNTTFQNGQVNINRTSQCGETNENHTYQEGRVNINQTHQGCRGQSATRGPQADRERGASAASGVTRANPPKGRPQR
jgi:hypothetical protein